MTETKDDVQMLERLGESTEVCVGMYNTKACLNDHYKYNNI
jgi:hypothetical protein